MVFIQQRVESRPSSDMVASTERTGAMVSDIPDERLMPLTGGRVGPDWLSYN